MANFAAFDEFRKERSDDPVATLLAVGGKAEESGGAKGREIRRLTVMHVAALPRLKYLSAVEVVIVAQARRINESVVTFAM
ncbi:MAG TPA: hypothetical protein VN579_03235 [Bryobacteraceae bacterium]|nr:hypothetical protein [Bryobacteraceae bacterium]